MYFLWFAVALLVVNVNAQTVQPQPTNVEGRLAYGEIAVRGQFPYQAMIIHSDSRACGALISIQHIITTAKAVTGLEQGVIILGALVLKKGDDEQIFEILKSNIIVHEEYEGDQFNNNMALITLPKEVKLTVSVAPVSLPTEIDYRNNFENKIVTVSGFGEREGGKLSKTLNYIKVPVTNPEACQADFEQAGDQVLCTDTQSGPMACRGDEGAPVIIDDPNTRIIGLVTIVSKCDNNSSPNVVSRVPEFVSWINERMHLGV